MKNDESEKYEIQIYKIFLELLNTFHQIYKYKEVEIEYAEKNIIFNKLIPILANHGFQYSDNIEKFSKF